MWLAFGSQVRELRDGELVIGSGADADWRIATADLRPRHFTLTIYDLNVSLRPSSRDSVVAVNGEQLIASTRLLNDGDVILAGSGAFVFSDNTPRDAPAQSQPPESRLVSEADRRVYRLISRSTAIGRDVSNVIVLRDPRTSRFHAEVRREAGGFALHSMGSGGTSLNGKKVADPILLAEGDIIEIAGSRLCFTAEPGESPSGTPETRPEHDIPRNPTLPTGLIRQVHPPTRLGPAAKVCGFIVALAILAAAIWFVRR